MNFNFNDILSSLDHIKGGIPLKKLSKTSRLGVHKSIFFGPSNNMFDIQEYDEERDPTNLIVWSLYDPDEDIIWVMKTVEEHETQIRFFVDLSSSIVSAGTDFSKRKMLLEAVGFIGMSGARYQDRVGLAGFTDRIVLNLPPRGGVIHFTHLLKTLYDYMERPDSGGRKTAARKTDFIVMLDFIKRTADKPCFIPIISDFIRFEEVFDSPQSLRLLKYVAARHEIIFIFIDDFPEISGMAGRGYLRIEDIETGRQAVIARKMAGEIVSSIRRHRTVLRKQKLRSLGIDSVVLEPGKQIPRLHKFFIKRRKLSGL